MKNKNISIDGSWFIYNIWSKLYNCFITVFNVFTTLRVLTLTNFFYVVGLKRKWQVLIWKIELCFPLGLYFHPRPENVKLKWTLFFWPRSSSQWNVPTFTSYNAKPLLILSLTLHLEHRTRTWIVAHSFVKKDSSEKTENKCLVALAFANHAQIPSNGAREKYG